MKTTYMLLALTASALLSPHVWAGNSNSTAYSHPVTRVEHLDRPAVQRGATVYEVLAYLGEPARKLGPNVWVYPNYCSSAEQLRKDGCSVLLVTLRDRVVTDLQLVNGRAEAVLAKRATTPLPMLAQVPGQESRPGS
jgi:hypothetical protein